MNIYRVLIPEQTNDGYRGIDSIDGTDQSVLTRQVMLKDAYTNNQVVLVNEETGKCRRILPTDASQYINATVSVSKPSNDDTAAPLPDVNESVAFIKSSTQIKPDALHMPDNKWRFLVRNVLRGKNVMMTGPAGSGKTLAAQSVANALKRPFYYFNLGATQDPRSTLIGNTHFNPTDGTVFSESLFVKAIQEDDAIILLDELSRAHPEAWNILMTVLDQNQRYLRIDEDRSSTTVRVAEGVSFIATANIGAEYTATRAMDRALLDRFIIVEMDVLDEQYEYQLLKKNFGNTVPDQTLRDISEIASITRKEVRTENPKISSAISTRLSKEMASLVEDGFTMAEAAEVAIYPFYDIEGGIDSERTFIKQLVQRYVGDPVTDSNPF